MVQLLAKSNSNLTLLDHQKSCINVAHVLLKRCVNESMMKEEKQWERIKRLILLGAGIHDIGKATKEFQTHIRNNKSAPKIKHNILSWAFNEKYIKETKEDKSIIGAAILYHHPVIDDMQSFDKGGKKNELEYISRQCFNEKLTGDDLNAMLGIFNEVAKYLKDEYQIKDISLMTEDERHYAVEGSITNVSILYDKFSVEKFDDNSGTYFDKNSIHMFVRDIVLLADRISSNDKFDVSRSLNNDIDYINSFIDDEFMKIKGIDGIKLTKENMIESFPEYDEDRLSGQFSLLERASHRIVDIDANAGYGKTLLGVIKIINSGKKGLWVVPENGIAEATYKSIQKELKHLQLSDKVALSLYYGGEFKKNTTENFDILVTNIDTFLSLNVKNSLGIYLLPTLCGNVIFDEYHKFASKTAMFLYFVALSHMMQQIGNSDVVYLSATPGRILYITPFFSNGDSPKKDLRGIDHIKLRDDERFGGDIPLVINKSKGSPEHAPMKDCIFYSPTTDMARGAYLLCEKENKILVHSRHTDNDLADKVDKVYATHGSKTSKELRDMAVFSSPYLGTAHDITAIEIFDTPLSPEDSIQRACGRGDRYNDKFYEEDGKKKPVTYNMCYLNEKTIEVCKKVNEREDTSLWWNFVIPEEIKTKNDFYSVYYRYNEEHKDNIKKQLYKMLTLSKDALYDVAEPYRARNKSKKSEKLSSATTFRDKNNTIYATIFDKSDIILTIDSNVIIDKPEMDDDYTKKRKSFIVEKRGKHAYENGLEAYGLKQYLKMLAKNKDYPFILFTYDYNYEFGLYKKNKLIPYYV